MAVTPDDVRHVARLARVGLEDAKLPALVAELNGILAHMEVLAQVPSAGAAATADAAREGMRPRPDQLGAAVPLATPREQFAPAMRAGFFLVPRLGTHEGAGDAS